ncbi:hypothetical protein [Pontiella sulfatireligans]|uniref:Uncharacterized protein n=1 Tax=Pontiella sulfatireligans TaxID=2750658 RepID=A0A6C2UFS8_9BACT|nr:hypothetical protein [Pontiella sulfatireligans]VGO18066.1 hypothetical protein SCARR_00117 [Pontiella sulfatireligans]
MKRKSRMKNLPSPISLKKNRLRSLAGSFENWFDDAVEPRIAEMQNESASLEMKIDALKNSLTHEQVDRNGVSVVDGGEAERPCDGDIAIYEQMGELYYDFDMNEERLLSVGSMRVVCLFKDFEIILKDLIAEAFSDVNKRDLFQWENVKSFLNSNGIPLGNVMEYESINCLRTVNNNIKHSGVIDEKIKRQGIPEFKDKEIFDSESVSSFYFRIRGKPGVFMNAFAEVLIAYLYEFDDARISTIASDYKERMDSVAGQKLIDALSEIYT